MSVPWTEDGGRISVTGQVEVAGGEVAGGELAGSKYLA